MDKNQLLKNIEEMELKLTEMKKELSKEKKPFPQKGDTYFTITADGTILSAVCEDNDGRFQVFKTCDEARNFYEVECAKKRVKDEIKKLNDGWTPDWNNEYQLKYFLYLVPKYGKLEKSFSLVTKTVDQCMYLKSSTLVNKLLETHEQDLFLILGQ